MLRILHGTNYDFIKYWKTAAITTAAFIVVGLGFLGVHGVNYSIEFLGGTLVQVHFTQPPGADAVRGAVDKAGFHDAEITQFGNPLDYTVKTPAPQGTAAAANADSTASIIQRTLQQSVAP